VEWGRGRRWSGSCDILRRVGDIRGWRSCHRCRSAPGAAQGAQKRHVMGSFRRQWSPRQQLDKTYTTVTDKTRRRIDILRHVAPGHYDPAGISPSDVAKHNRLDTATRAIPSALHAQIHWWGRGSPYNLGGYVTSFDMLMRDVIQDGPSETDELC